MSNTSAHGDVGAPISSKKDSLKLPTSFPIPQSPSSARSSNSPAIRKLNFASSPTDAANKQKKSALVPSLSIQARNSSSTENSNNPNREQIKSLSQVNARNRHHIHVSDISPASHKNAMKDQLSQQPQESQQQNKQTDPTANRAKVPTPPVPLLNFSSMSRSCQSLNVNRAPIPPMNIGLGSCKTVSGFNLDLPEEYSAKNVNRAVLICLPWTIIPTSADHVNKNYNINNNLRSENGYSSRSQKPQETSVTTNNDNNNNNNNNNSASNLDFDDSALNELINSTFYSNRIFYTPDVLPDTIIIEEEEVISNASSCNSGRSTSPESSSNSPRSYHNAHHSLKLTRSILPAQKSGNISLNSPAPEGRPKVFVQRTASLTPNSPKPFNFLAVSPGGQPTVVSEVSSDSIPSLQVIDVAYQRVQHFPLLIEQTNTESTHLMTHIETIINEIELLRDERERLHVQNEILRSNINQTKSEIKIYSESQAKMKQIVELLKAKGIKKHENKGEKT